MSTQNFTQSINIYRPFSVCYSYPDETQRNFSGIVLIYNARSIRSRVLFSSPVSPSGETGKATSNLQRYFMRHVFPVPKMDKQYFVNCYSLCFWRKCWFFHCYKFVSSKHYISTEYMIYHQTSSEVFEIWFKVFNKASIYC